MLDDLISSYYDWDFECEGHYTLYELWTTSGGGLIVRKCDEEGECFFEKNISLNEVADYGFKIEEEVI